MASHPAGSIRSVTNRTSVRCFDAHCRTAWRLSASHHAQGFPTATSGNFSPADRTSPGTAKSRPARHLVNRPNDAVYPNVRTQISNASPPAVQYHSGLPGISIPRRRP